MAICTTVDASGVVHAAGNISINDCTGFVLLDKADYVQNGLVQQLFALPAGEDFSTLWAAGFVMPMTIGLVAWACAVLVSMWKERND